jgi:hypothetical protein
MHGQRIGYIFVLAHLTNIQSGNWKASKSTMPEVKVDHTLTTHIFSAFRIEEMAVPHVEQKLVFHAMGDWGVGVEPPNHGLACDVHMHNDFVAHELDELHRAPDDSVRVRVRAPVQDVFGSDAELDLFVRVGFHCVSLVCRQG